MPSRLPKQARNITAYSMTARCEPLEEHVVCYCWNAFMGVYKHTGRNVHCRSSCNRKLVFVQQ